MICVAAGGTFGKGKVCVLMEAIPDSASVFGLIIAVFFLYIRKPFRWLNVACL